MQNNKHNNNKHISFEHSRNEIDTHRRDLTWTSFEVLSMNYGKSSPTRCVEREQASIGAVASCEPINMDHDMASSTRLHLICRRPILRLESNICLLVIVSATRED